MEIFDLWTILEVLAVIFSLMFVVFVAKGYRLGWLFGALASILYLIIFVNVMLYFECLISVYYIYTGIWGYWKFGSHRQIRAKDIRTHRWVFHIYGVIACVCCASVFAFFVNRWTLAALPYLDALTTVFSFFATYLMVKCYHENWIYWIGIDFTTAILYGMKDLYYSVALMVCFMVLAGYGYRQWTKILKRA